MGDGRHEFSPSSAGAVNRRRTESSYSRRTVAPCQYCEVPAPTDPEMTTLRHYCPTGAAASLATLPRRSSVALEEVGYGHDALVVVFQVVLLVRRVQAVIRETEPHQHRRNAEVLREIADNRNRST